MDKIEKIGIASDHGGYSLKEYIKKHFKYTSIELIDYGADNKDVSDYPDYAAKLGLAISKCEIQRGIAICKSGHGMCMTVNKFKGVRASNVFSKESLKQGIEDDDLNVACISANLIKEEDIMEIVDSLVNCTFLSSVERYLRRKNKLLAIEEKNFK